MTQYLLSIYQPDGPPAPPEDLEPIMRDRYHLFHAIRADLLRRLGRDAAAAYDAALARTQNPAERRLLRSRRDATR